MKGKHVVQDLGNKLLSINSNCWINKTGKILKHTFKAILLVVIGFVLIIILLILVIRIPAVQNKVAGYTASYFSKKTHTRVELKKVRISFPKSVVIEGFYLEDNQGDTLLYAGTMKIHMTFHSLISRKIAISSFDLEDAAIRLYNSRMDSRFNYISLMMALTDTTKGIKTATHKASKWRFSLDKVFLKNVRFSYNDVHAGIKVFAAVIKSNFSMDELDPGKSVYSFEEIFVDGLIANVLRSDSLDGQGNRSGNNPPILSAGKVQIIHSSLAYVDSVAALSVHAFVDRLVMEDALFDLTTELLTMNSLYLSKSQVRYYNFESGKSQIPVQTAGSKWKVSLMKVDFDDISILVKKRAKPYAMNTFDPDYLDYDHLFLNATDFYYSANQVKVFLKKFSTTDQNNFSITGFDTGICMDGHSITATNLNVKMPGSSINADLNLQFSSFTSFKDSLQFNLLHAEIRNVSIRNSDILYFSPMLTRLPFFKNRMNTTTISGVIDGPLNKLTGNNIVIKTGINTVLKTGFSITGLPEVLTATFNFPDLVITSGKKDIEMMAGPSISKNVELPGNLSMQIKFKGQMRSFESFLQMNSSLGDVSLTASVSAGENFKAKIRLSSFDLGNILRDTMLYGPVSLTAEANGQGLDLKTVRAKIKAYVNKIYLHEYTYHNLKLEGTITGRQFAGKINLDDENAGFDLDGVMNLNPNQKSLKFRLNVPGADLQKLNFTREDIRIGLVAESDLKGESLNKLNGTAGIYNITVTRGEKKYVLDSVILASVNKADKSELKINSAPVSLKYSGTVSPADLSADITNFINLYFPFSDSHPLKKESKPSDFNFEMQLHNHPILSQVLLPKLKEFSPGVIQGSFDSQKNDLRLKATMKKIVYGTTEIKDFAVDVNSDATALNYKILSSNISNAQFGLTDFSFDGKLTDHKIFANISSTDDKQNKKLLIRSQMIREHDKYKLTLDPEEFFLMDNKWEIAADNYIEFGKQGFLVHHLYMDHAESMINIASVHDRFNDNLNIAIYNFRLDDISRIIEKDTSLVKGIVGGNILLKRVDNTYGLIADAKISDLAIREVPIGNISVKAENPVTGKFDVEVSLSGPGNNLSANGYLITNKGNNSINIETKIDSLSMKTIEAFSMGKITEAAGTLAGNILFEGVASAPGLTGELIFHNAFLKPVALNNRLELKHETVQFTKDGVYFKSFTISDADRHTAVVDGAVQMKQFKDFIFALQVSTKDFVLFNTTAKDNKVFFGRMIVDSKIDVNGPLTLPVVNAKIKVQKGSDFTFAVPEERLTTNKGEDVVEFEDSLKLNPILERNEKNEIQRSGITGLDLSSIIEIDKEAMLRLLMDPSSTDALVVKGEAALSFTMDRSGKMILTGAYHLDEGSYLVSLESVIKKKFDIKAGSTIIWNGDPLGADISIDATYSVRASPYDLVADQMSGLSDVDKGGYKLRYPFLVLLKLRGEILHPVISFEIQLQAADRGILGGAVTQKLSMLNEDPSALNKQVFALLVLGRFVQENPFQTESSGTTALIRSTVGKFLSTQLNQLSSRVLPGMGLNFDIQSYNDYQSGQAQGRTQVEVGLKKELFNERLSLQLGGAFDIEGEKAKQNSASDITSDVTVEFKLTKDGRFRMRGFRHNQYEGAIEGQLVETGVGITFVRDFNQWSRLFRSQKNRSDSVIKRRSNDTINPE